MKNKKETRLYFHALTTNENWRRKNMDIKEAYLKMQKASGIKVGDRVRVLRKAKSHEMGWDNTWETSMDDSVGEVFTVDRIAGNYGLGLGTWNYPFFVLEKVEKIEEPEKKPEKKPKKKRSLTVKLDVDVEPLKSILERLDKPQAQLQPKLFHFGEPPTTEHIYLSKDKDGWTGVSKTRPKCMTISWCAEGWKYFPVEIPFPWQNSLFIYRGGGKWEHIAEK